MQISELYDALDGLVQDATDNAEAFAEDGELKQLSARLFDIGNRAFSIGRGVDAIAEALKFENSF